MARLSMKDRQIRYLTDRLNVRSEILRVMLGINRFEDPWADEILASVAREVKVLEYTGIPKADLYRVIHQRMDLGPKGDGPNLLEIYTHQADPNLKGALMTSLIKEYSTRYGKAEA